MLLLVCLFLVRESRAEVPQLPPATGTKPWLDANGQSTQKSFDAWLAEQRGASPATATAQQRAGLEALFAKQGANLRLTWSAALDTPAEIRGIQYGPGKDAQALGIDFAAEHMDTLRDLFGLGSDEFLAYDHAIGTAKDGAGLIHVYRRFKAGLLVRGDYLHVYVAASADAKMVNTHYTVRAITAKMHRNVTALAVPDAWLSDKEALQEVAKNKPVKLTSAEVQIVPLEDGARVTQLLHCDVEGGEPTLFAVDAITGQVYAEQSQVMHRTGTIKVPATNPYEFYDPSVGKTLKPLPHANIYRGVTGSPSRGNPSRFHGTTNYHGQYDLPATTSDGTICSNCWTIDFLFEASGNNDLKDATAVGVSTFHHLLNNILSTANGATYNLPWSIFNRGGRRTELAYHLGYAREFIEGFAGSFVQPIVSDILYESSCVPCGDPGACEYSAACFGGLAHCNSIPCPITLICGQYADLVTESTTENEIRARNSIYHEFTHVAEFSSRNAGANVSELDFPDWTSGNLRSFIEGTGAFGSGLLSDFESQIGSWYSESQTYPANYSCSSGYAGSPHASIWNDYILAAGPFAIKSVIWHWADITSYPTTPKTRLIDCTNLTDFGLCTNSDTLYNHLLNAAALGWDPQLQTSFEVSKAFHTRVTDSDPQIDCTGTDEKTLAIGDPDSDYFPFADDTTNLSRYASLIPFGFPPSGATHNASTTDWAYVELAPDSCRDSSASNCKKLAFDNDDDYDKWSIWARGGETYSISTELSTIPGQYMDSVLTITDASGTTVNKCGSSGTDACENDDCVSCVGIGLCSCLTFKPTATDDYRIAVRQYWAGNYDGADAVYKVKVRQIDDDHGDTLSAATPLPADGTARASQMNTTSDDDYFFVVATGSDTLYYKACGTGFNPYVRVYNQSGTLVASYTFSSCSYQSLSVSKGAYYLRVSTPSSAGAYTIQTSLSSDVGDTTGAALYLYDTGYTFPSGPIAVPQTLSGTSDKDVYKFWAAKGDTFTIDVSIGATGGSGGLVTKLVRPPSAFLTGWSPYCTDDYRNFNLGGPTYVTKETQSGVIRANSEIRANNHVSLTAPTDGYYHIEVSNTGTGAVPYVFHFNYTGPLTGQYPEMP